MFAKHLKELMKEEGVKNYELAEAIGCFRGTITYYKTGKIEPTLHNLIAIADYFDVSIDWLVGREVKI